MNVSRSRSITIEIKCLRNDIQAHFSSKQLANCGQGKEISKDKIRQLYRERRLKKLHSEKIKLQSHCHNLLNFFANGDELNPTAIAPRLEAVESSRFSGLLFRFASLLWSVPVSQGFGRRLRFLVIDQNNNKLIGLLALGDPVFNLGVRDRWIGWDLDTKKAKLANIMDGYVLGAVPPYSQILGGKLIVSLLASREVSNAFRQRYSDTVGTISKKPKNAHLSMITIASAFGRSSVYSRLKLKDGPSTDPGKIALELISIGYTQGYGHFQFPDELFDRIRNLLNVIEHPYARSYEFGQGSNWKFRVIREGLRIVGLADAFLLHGIKREVFVLCLGNNVRQFLNGKNDALNSRLSTIEQISEAAKRRWVIPRAERLPQYQDFRKEQILEIMGWNDKPESLLALSPSCRTSHL